MDEAYLKDVFSSVIAEDEWSQIPSQIATKLQNFVVNKFEELLTTKALSETSKFNAEAECNELREKLTACEDSANEYNIKFSVASKTIEDLEAQISTCTSDLNKLQTSCNRLEAEAADFRHQRNLAVGERDELAKLLERSSAEVQRLQMDVTTLTNQLQTAISAKCEALAEANEVTSMKLTLEYKEKRLDQERTLLKNQMETLNQSLTDRTEELLNLKKDNSLRCIQLENKLIEKSQELAISLESIKNLTNINQDLTIKIEELNDKLREERDKDSQTQELYQQEIEAQTKLANLYKNMSDENKEHADELVKAVSELQTLLREATEKYGDLETKHKESQLANEEIIGKKNECINMLKQELDASNELFKALKDENVQKEVEGLSPLAASASRLIKPNMSLTQIYTQYMNVSTELTHAKEESQKLNMYITEIFNQLEESGPLLKKQREDYENAIDTIKEITQQNDALILENQHLKEDALQFKKNENSVIRENARFKKENADLSRQVCHLLREVELSRVGSSSTSTDQDMSDSISSGDIITKRLVTFSDISELQSTNQRLLALVRELTAKQEEVESMDPAAIAQLKMKLEHMKETQGNLLEQQESQNKMMTMVIGQRDMYKTLYEQAMKGTGEDIPMQLERPYIPERERDSQSPKHDDSDSHSDDKMQDLESQLVKLKKEINTIKEEYDTYKKEKAANEKMVLNQVEEMRKEALQLTRQNCKLTSACEMHEEKHKVMQSNTKVLRNQIDSLEKQNRIYNESIIKHEQTVSYLKDETLQSQTKLSKAEVKLANLEKENALLLDRETRLVSELEFLKKEAHSKNVLHANIELIKATLERNDAESRIRLEERLDEAHRECAALRRRLQEEQDHFRELGGHLEKQTLAVQSQMEDEKNAATKLRKEIAEVREELIAKQTQIEELTKKLKNSMMIIPDCNVESSKFRELERILHDSQAEVQSLQQQLKIAKETVEQHCSVAEGAEKQLKMLVEEQEGYRKNMEDKLKAKDTQIKKLEEQCSELQGELSIQGDDPNMASLGLRSRLHNMEFEFKSIQTELQETKENLAAAQSEIKELSTNLEAAENKYAQEMFLHTNDLKALTSIKEELATALNEIEELKHAKEQAVSALEENKNGWLAQEQFFQKEKEELQTRFKNMDEQNTLLLDQIQTLNTQISLIQAQATDQNQSLSSSDLNLSRSFTEDEVKASEQLLKIIKYLRQEKDISVSKCEILEAEHVRLKSQYDLMTKQFEEAKSNLDAERQKSEISIVTAAKHAEVLRRVETLNAMTDSNRSLRQERDGLLQQINELRSRTSSLEEQVAPLQEKNKELSLRVEAVHTENVTLRGEATRWRQRANLLIEKSNRTSPEDWKKLQNERESLAKQLTIERGTTAKLNDDLNNVRQEKTKLEEQLRVIRFQHTQLNEEFERTRDELGKVNEQVQNVLQDLEHSKTNYTKLADEKQKIENEANSRTLTITELKNNLIAVRKIAKKYKQQFEDLTKEMEVIKKENEEKSKNEAMAVERQEQLQAEARSELQERISQLELSHNEKLGELTQQMSSATEETDNYKKEIEVLKQTSSEKEERFKTLFKNAKDRIVTLTEQNNNLRSELMDLKSNNGQDDSGKANEIERLLREKEEILTERQQERERLNNEIEMLTQRVNQLQRQLAQQSSKPSTSSGSSEKSTTEPPTANIKPMAGHSTNTQTQSIQIQPWRTGPETPLASIRPMSMQLRTITVLPTSQGASTSQGPVIVTPQVHTTGPSSIEPLSSSPTSSHTEYMPATSSATPTVVTPRQVAVPPTQSTQDMEDEDNNMQMQPAPQQQAVALVLPRVEQPNNGPAQESGTSSSSSNTVTTTQAGLKRPREVDTDSCQADEQTKSQQQTKRTRLQQGSTEALQSHGTVTDSGLEVEYQVPTSSQRDHEEDTDAVIVVESDDDDDDGDGPDEGEGADDDQDDPDTEGYDMEAYQEQEMNYDDADCQDIEEEEEAGNEVEVVEDSNEVPNQSERSMQENVSQEESSEQAQSEAISSGTDGTTGVTVSQASQSITATMLPTFSRSRPVAPLTRQQQSHLLLSHGIDEGGDDGIVPSTPTLFVPRRSDGFGEAVSSPHVPTSGRFTFSESTPSNNCGSMEIIPEQTLEFSNTDDNSTGRSVPSTPLQASPQESGPPGEEHVSHQSISSEPELPLIMINEEPEAGPEGSLAESMGPPTTAGTSTDVSQPMEQQHEEMSENEDGVTSEGEKPPTSEENEEEGREAEASPSTNTRSRSQNRGNGTVARRSVRHSQVRGGIVRPIPIIWNEQQHHSTRQQTHRGGRGQPNFQPRVARRSRGRAPRGPYRF